MVCWQTGKERPVEAFHAQGKRQGSELVDMLGNLPRAQKILHKQGF
jgi:hypothetical protein